MQSRKVRLRMPGYMLPIGVCICIGLLWILADSYHKLRMLTNLTENILMTEMATQQKIGAISIERSQPPSSKCDCPKCKKCNSMFNLIKLPRFWLALIHNDGVSETILRRGVWEKETTEYLENHIRPGQTIVELGANIGYYTNLKIYSYECNSDVYNLAMLSLRMNDFDHIVDMRNLAVTDRAGYFNFSYYPLSVADEKYVNIGNSRLETGSISKDRAVKQVRTVALDEDLSQVSNIDWLRMDIEGSEILALKGAQNLLQSSPNIKIIMEWSIPNLQRISDPKQFLIDIYGQGFRFYPIEDPSQTGPMTLEYMLEHGDTYTNYLLTRPAAYSLL